MAGYVKPEIMGAITTLGGAAMPPQKSALDEMFNAKMRALQEETFASTAVPQYIAQRPSLKTMTMATNYGKSVIHCSLERIENGYLVRTAQNEGQVSKVYYAEDLKAAGEQITALAVSYDLGGGGDDVTRT